MSPVAVYLAFDYGVVRGGEVASIIFREKALTGSRRHFYRWDAAVWLAKTAAMAGLLVWF